MMMGVQQKLLLKLRSCTAQEWFSPLGIVLPIVVTALWILHRWQQSTRLFKMGNKLPGPMPLPLVGHALMALGKDARGFTEIGLRYREAYGSVIKAFLGPKLYVFLTDPKDAEVILSSNVHIDKAPEYRFFKPWLGEGLLISSGEKWRSHRKMIAPTFHVNILKSFMSVFNQNSNNVVNKMKADMNNTFDVHDYMSEATVDILLETVMGITKTTQDKSGLDYAMAVMKMCDIVQMRQFKLWLHFDVFFKYTSIFKLQCKLLNTIHSLTKKVIELKKQTYSENKAKGIIPTSIEELTRSNDGFETGLAYGEKSLADTVFKGYQDDLDVNDENDVGEKKRLAFLDLMLESAQSGTNNISDHEFKEEVDTIMFEGHDTTAAGASFVLCLLGVHQDIQAKVYEELYEIFGDSDRPVTYSDTLGMKYLERVILEAVRLYPPVPLIGRHLKQDVKICTNDYVLPAGTTVLIGIFHIHRDTKNYKNPGVFDPDNFLPENSQNRHYYSYIPFSSGPRSCVGRKYAMLKLKVLLATILRNFKMVSDIPEDQFELQADIILKRADGFRVKIEPRKRAPSTA